MTGNLWHVEDSVGASLHISLAELVVKVGAVFRWCVWLTVDMWPGRPEVVPNMVVFHDDVDAFVLVFGQFSSN
jgi:hypothetical protein